MALEDQASRDELTAQLQEAQGRIAELEELHRAHHHSEQALLLSEERFRKIFDNSNDGIFVVDPDQDRIVDVNHRACLMLGYSREELLAKRVSEIHPNEMPQLQAFADKVAEHGQGWTDELTCRTCNGEFLPAEMSASIIDIEGSPHMIALVRDISDRKRAEEALRTSEERFRQLVESAPDAVMGINARGRIVMLNQQAERIFGHSRQELIGESVEKLVPERFRQVHPEHRARYDVQPGTRVMGAGLDLFGRRKDGTEFPVDVSLSQVQTEEGPLTVSIIRDVTDRKQFEETLQEVAVLEERNRLAREIHDTLAQGLTGMIWQINAAQRIVSQAGPQALEYLERIRNLARESLQEARRSVWDLSSGPLQGQTLAHALNQETNRINGETATSASFSVTGKETVLPPGVEAALLRICQESLANVLKYSRANGVSVALSFEDSQVTLSVQDNGIGFDPGSNGGHQQDSGGFGLINMRERARLIGGTLAVYSSPGQGTRIEARVPIIGK